MGDSPILWLKGPPRISQKGALTIIDGDDHLSTRDKILGGSIFAFCAGFLLLWSLGVFIATGDDFDDDNGHAASCENIENYNVTLGGNRLYCVDGFEQESGFIEISDDQHIRERGYCPTGSGEEECGDEYRWENIDIFVVYGFLDDEGHYHCEYGVSAAELPNDWRVEDLLEHQDGFSFPEWCDSTATNQENRTYEEGVHPHEGVWLYWLRDGMPVETMNEYIKSIKFEDGDREIEWLMSQWMNTMNAHDDSDDDQVLRWSLCCTVPIGLLFLLAADRRRDVLVLDCDREKITVKKAGWFPSIPEVWSDASFKNARARSKSLASWETNNHEAQSGFEVVLPVEDEDEETLLFVDLSESSVPLEKIMSDVLAAMGAEQSAIEPMSKPKKNKPEKGGAWGFKPAEASTSPSAPAIEDQGTESALTDPFWSTDQAEEP